MQPSLPAAPGDVRTTISIGGTPYDSVARSDADFESLNELTVHLGSGNGELHWAVKGTGPIPPFAIGSPVVLSVSIGGGSPFTVFTGDISDLVSGQGREGWSHEFLANDFRRRADRITITARDGSGQAIYNRPPTEGAFYVSSQAGLAVGAIVADVLTVAANANALDAAGIGNFAGLPATPVLPAATLADLANLTMVPSSRVTLGGEGLFNQIASFVEGWHPKYASWIQPDGTIRCTDTTSMPPMPLVLPGEAADFDPTTWPHATADVEGCFTAVTILGKDVQPAFLSTALGSLTPAHSPNAAWATADETAWTIAAYRGTGDTTDSGNVSALTANSCTVTSSSGSAHWITNFWSQSNRQGWIALMNPATTGATFLTWKKITSCTALTAGGSATVTWDSADPVDSLSYTKYQIVGDAGAVADVGRLFLVRDPNSGATGLSTYIGSRLEAAFPQPIAFGRGSSAFLTSTEQGWVLATSGGIPLQYLVSIEVVPALGGIRFTQPVVLQSAPAWVLQTKYPASTAEGLPTDVQALVAYNREDLSVRSPATGFSGTAFSVYGIQRLKTIFLDDDFTLPGQTTQLQVLCDELLAVYQDAVVSGSIGYHGWPTWNTTAGAAFNPLALGYSLNLTIAGTTSPWDSLNLPVRSVTVRWPQGTGDQHFFTFAFSNERRPLRDTSVYIHPATPAQSGAGQMPFEGAQVGQVRQPGGQPGSGAGEIGFDPAALAAKPGMERGPVSSVPWSRMPTPAGGTSTSAVPWSRAPGSDTQPPGSGGLSPLVGPEPPGGTPPAPASPGSQSAEAAASGAAAAATPPSPVARGSTLRERRGLAKADDSPSGDAA